MEFDTSKLDIFEISALGSLTDVLKRVEDEKISRSLINAT